MPYATIHWFGFAVYDSMYEKPRWLSLDVDDQETVDLFSYFGMDNRLTCPKWFDVPVPWFVEYL